MYTEPELKKKKKTERERDQDELKFKLILLQFIYAMRVTEFVLEQAGE